jgi:hypothetical protein
VPRKKLTKRKSTSQASKPRTPKEEAVQEAQASLLGGVQVLILAGDDGERRQVTPIEGTKVTELPTLLRLAAVDVERSLGIE